MSNQAGCRSVAVIVFMFVLCIALIALPASAGESLDQAKAAPSQDSTKPTTMRGPMRGEMKKDGMMKEDVSKAAQTWSKKMDEQMGQEKKK